MGGEGTAAGGKPGFTQSSPTLRNQTGPAGSNQFPLLQDPDPLAMGLPETPCGGLQVSASLSLEL